jgi:hypothetical protein
MIDFELKQNTRTADLGFATNKRCEKCGCVTSAYLEVTMSEPSPFFISPSPFLVSRGVICKGCLLNGVNIIDKGILEQAKKKV